MVVLVYKVEDDCWNGCMGLIDRMEVADGLICLSLSPRIWRTNGL